MKQILFIWHKKNILNNWKWAHSLCALLFLLKWQHSIQTIGDAVEVSKQPGESWGKLRFYGKVSRRLIKNWSPDVTPELAADPPASSFCDTMKSVTEHVQMCETNSQCYVYFPKPNQAVFWKLNWTLHIYHCNLDCAMRTCSVVFM